MKITEIITESTVALDDRHRQAVESENLGLANALVQRAARQAGFNIGPVYHASHTEGITQFKAGNVGGVFFSENPRDLEFGKVVYSVYLKMDDPWMRDYESVWDLLTDRQMREIIRNRHEDVEDDPRWQLELAEQEEMLWQDPIIVNAIKQLGHNGIIAHDGFGGSKEYVALYPNQIKSAEPATFDSNGNLIPLSKRFNTNSSNIAEVIRRHKQMSIPSPCLNLCSMGDDGYCEGCLRTIEEIATWGTLSDEEQLHIITEVIPERDHAQKSQ